MLAPYTDTISTPAARLGRDGQVLQFDGVSQLPPVQITSGKLPTTTAEFLREWKRNRISNRSRCDLLCQLTPSDLLKIFKVELNSVVLSDIISAFEECWKGDAEVLDGGTPGDCGDENQGTESRPCPTMSAVTDKLQALTQSKGFGMACKLLSSATKSTLQILIHRLLAAARSAPSAESGDSQRILE